jgi:hypothetical protein
MIPFNVLLQHSLLYGAIVSAGLTAIILVSLRYWPMVWIHDAPAEVRAVAPPLTEADRRVQRVVTVLFFGWMLVVLAASLLGLRALGGGSVTFADAALSTFIIWMTFNLVDLLLIDWLLLLVLRPNLYAFPGVAVEHPFGSYTYHFVGFLKGTLIGVGFSLIVGAVAAVVW